MKCITLKQPYASLVAKGYKKYEFRKWKTKYRGEIYIHAGKGIDKKNIKRFEYLNLDYPQGVIIAKAEIVDCIEITDDIKNKLKELDIVIYKGAIEHTGKNEYGFVLENIKEIDPIPIKGQLGLWNYNEER